MTVSLFCINITDDFNIKPILLGCGEHAMRFDHITHNTLGGGLYRYFIQFIAFALVPMTALITIACDHRTEYFGTNIC